MTSMIGPPSKILRAAARPTECKTAFGVARFGCNEPGPFPERYLDRGTPGSLLMAFPGTGNKGVTSTEAANRRGTHRTALAIAGFSRPDPGDNVRSLPFSPFSQKANLKTRTDRFRPGRSPK